MKRIVIESIPQSEQLYATCGDYKETDDEIRIVVSDLGDEKMEWLIAVHELVEVMLMKAAGIPLQASTDFDLEFEARAATALDSRGRHVPNTMEPGDAPDSPYQLQHNYATAVERMVCAALGVKWADYEKAVEALFP